jgi:hypothetical protein
VKEKQKERWRENGEIEETNKRKERKRKERN